MEMLKKFEPLALLLMFVGALNWGILAITDTNVVSEIFGTGTLATCSTCWLGLGLVFVPRLMEAFHIGGPHPRGV